MDNIITPLPQVTTGPLPASRKVYVTPDTAPDLSVPLREIELSDRNEPPVRVYDTTGPYTDPAATIDARAGLPRTRRAWVLERGRGAASTASPSPSSNGRAWASSPRK